MYHSLWYHTLVWFASENPLPALQLLRHHGFVVPWHRRVWIVTTSPRSSACQAPWFCGSEMVPWHPRVWVVSVSPPPALQLVRHQGGSDGTMALESLAGSLPPSCSSCFSGTMVLRYHGTKECRSLPPPPPLQLFRHLVLRYHGPGEVPEGSSCESLPVPPPRTLQLLRHHGLLWLIVP